MEVIHDWADEQGGKTLDIVMLAVPGGLQRTAEEYDTLLASAGFRLERVIDTGAEATAAGLSIMEAVPS